MINITSKSNCCGCQACGDACAKGFWYLEVDKAKCVNCGLCEKVCPILGKEKKVGGESRWTAESSKSDNDHCQPSPRLSTSAPKVPGGYHKNIAVRFDSTSGGAFSALANAMYRQGGYVAGAVQSTDDWSVRNFISNNKRDLGKLRSSKYLQSAAAGLYKRIAELLKSGEKVLACGSPCQMAALRTYLASQSSTRLTI